MAHSALNEWVAKGQQFQGVMPRQGHHKGQRYAGIAESQRMTVAQFAGPKYLSSLAGVALNRHSDRAMPEARHAPIPPYYEASGQGSHQGECRTKIRTRSW